MNLRRLKNIAKLVSTTEKSMLRYVEFTQNSIVVVDGFRLVKAKHEIVFTGELPEKFYIISEDVLFIKGNSSDMVTEISELENNEVRVIVMGKNGVKTTVLKYLLPEEVAYPNYESIIPEISQRHAFAVNAKLLQELLNIFTGSKDANKVIFKVKAGNPLSSIMLTTEETEVFSLIMPLRYEAKN